jgi:hypothetical protein
MMILSYINEKQYDVEVHVKLYRNDDWFFIEEKIDGDPSYHLIPINLSYRINVTDDFNQSELFNENMNSIETDRPIKIDFDFSLFFTCISSSTSIISSLSMSITVFGVMSDTALFL